MAGNGEFTKNCWNYYTDEALLVALLGISAPNPGFRLAPEALTNWTRPVGRYKGEPFIYSYPGALFTYTFAQCFIDFRRAGKDPLGIDWFKNTVEAVKANCAWCRDHAKIYANLRSGPLGDYRRLGTRQPLHHSRLPALRPSGRSFGRRHAAPLWRGHGIAVCARRGHGRIARDAHFQGRRPPDLERPRAWRLRFCRWVQCRSELDRGQVFSIAEGPMLLQVENARSGLVWDRFMGHPAIRDGLKRARFQGDYLLAEPTSSVKRSNFTAGE